MSVYKNEGKQESFACLTNAKQNTSTLRAKRKEKLPKQNKIIIQKDKNRGCFVPPFASLEKGF